MGNINHQNQELAIQQENSERNIVERLVAAIRNFPQITYNSYNPYYKSRFASLDHILELTTPHLLEQGLFVNWYSQVGDDGSQYIGLCIHSVDMEKMDCGSFLLPPSDGLQKQMGYVTYIKRYLYCMSLGIAMGTDNDGNGDGDESASNNETPKFKSKEDAINWAMKKSNLSYDDCEKILDSIQPDENGKKGYNFAKFINKKYG